MMRLFSLHWNSQLISFRAGGGCRGLQPLKVLNGDLIWWGAFEGLIEVGLQVLTWNKFRGHWASPRARLFSQWSHCPGSTVRDAYRTAMGLRGT